MAFCNTEANVLVSSWFNALTSGKALSVLGASTLRNFKPAWIAAKWLETGGADDFSSLWELVENDGGGGAII